MYAKKAGMDLKGQNILAEGRIRAERKAGKLLKDMDKAKGGRPKTGDTVSPVSSLSNLGVTKKQSSRWQKEASVPEKVFEKHIQTVTENDEELTSAGVRDLLNTSNVHVSQNSGNNEWYTPKTFIESAREVMGSIDVDPASSAKANKVVKADIFFTEKDDGLSFEWSGTVFMNPPYASDLISKFTTHLVDEIECDRVTQAIVLVNNATETKWFQALADKMRAVCFPASRVDFWHPSGKPSAPLQGQAILYYGLNRDAFCVEFLKYGVVYRGV